jgi:hypothetical protein
MFTAIVRFDAPGGSNNLKNFATVVKVLPSRVLAEQEAAGLREVNEGKECIYAADYKIR